MLLIGFFLISHCILIFIYFLKCIKSTYVKSLSICLCCIFLCITSDICSSVKIKGRLKKCWFHGICFHVHGAACSNNAVINEGKGTAAPLVSAVWKSRFKCSTSTSLSFVFINYQWYASIIICAVILFLFF